MMDPEIQIVRETWHSAAGKPGADIGALFYNRLFENLPQLPCLFQNDLKDQSKKFMSMIGYIIYKLDHANVFHEVRTMGKKHSIHGISQEHFEYLKQSLLWALKAKLGNKWTAQAMVAWIWFFSVLNHFLMDQQRSSI